MRLGGQEGEENLEGVWGEEKRDKNVFQEKIFK